MKITVLGCGSSGGVPLIGGNWGSCDPGNPRNRRMRPSILVEDGGRTVLVDTGPDLRQQMLDNDVRALDAVIYTHAHADHCHGIDELRSINWMTGRPIDVHADAATLDELKQRFAYIFDNPGDDSFKPRVRARAVGGDFTAGGLPVRATSQKHGAYDSLGLRFGDFAYSTDVHELSEANFEFLAGVRVWLVDCTRPTPHPTHSHLAQTLQWIERVQPERAYFTHMNQQMDYDTLMRTLPSGVEPAYDGMVIEC